MRRAIRRLWVFLTKWIVREPRFHNEVCRKGRRCMRRPDGRSPRDLRYTSIEDGFLLPGAIVGWLHIVVIVVVAVARGIRYGRGNLAKFAL